MNAGISRGLLRSIVRLLAWGSGVVLSICFDGYLAFLLNVDIWFTVTVTAMIEQIAIVVVTDFYKVNAALDLARLEHSSDSLHIFGMVSSVHKILQVFHIPLL